MRLVPSSFVVVPLAAVLSSGACVTASPHVDIGPAPPLNASYDERAAYFKQNALDSYEGDHVFLHGGTRVYYPEDLLPAVDPGSPTAKAIHEHVAAREKLDAYAPLGYAATGAAVIGLGSLTVMSVTPLLYVNETTQDIAIPALVGTAAIGLGGLGAWGVLAMTDAVLESDDATKASEAADRAARTYQQSLSDNTGISVDGDGRLIDMLAGMEAQRPDVHDTSL